MPIHTTCPACSKSFRASDSFAGRNANCPHCQQLIKIAGRHVSRYDAFISYSSKDKDVAVVVVNALEDKGVRCWVAPRDITPGKEWSECIIEGIEQSAAFVLIFSENANESKQVIREVERAIAKSIPVIPFRIEDVSPSKALEYFISAQHWLNAYTPPIQQHATHLADTIRRLTGGSSRGGGPRAEPIYVAPLAPRPSSGRTFLVGCLVFVLVSFVLCCGGYGTLVCMGAFGDGSGNGGGDGIGLTSPTRNDDDKGKLDEPIGKDK